MPVVWTEYHPSFDPSEPGESAYGCFGFVEGTLYLGDTHHALILAGMINGEYGKNWTWEELAAAKQVWGWYSIEDKHYDARYVGEINFATDDAKQSFGLKAKLAAAFKEAYPGISIKVQKNIGSYGQGGTTQEDYGASAREQYLGEGDGY